MNCDLPTCELRLVSSKLNLGLMTASIQLEWRSNNENGRYSETR